MGKVLLLQDNIKTSCRNAVHTHRVRSKNKWSPELRVRKGELVLLKTFCMHVFGAGWYTFYKTFLTSVNMYNQKTNYE